jgi:hypothetical protein
MEQSSARPVFVGIDVAKGRLDVHLRPSGEAFAVARAAMPLRRWPSGSPGSPRG